MPPESSKNAPAGGGPPSEPGHAAGEPKALPRPDVAPVVRGKARGSEGSGTPSWPMRLATAADGPPPLVFHRGTRAPYATRWFGVTSLAGHARNLVASAIAAESIDSRDWMHAASADELLTHVVRVLGGDGSARSLVEAMGRAVWVDFIADTGDDRDVSHAVARMLFATYAVEEGGSRRILPRGDVLVFGGDTAYPVATGEEIARRVVAPFNEAVRERDDGHGDGERRRVVLGIPGNHDWYDGLDGFARLFRRRAPIGAPVDGTAASLPDEVPNAARRRSRRRAGVVARQLHLDEVGGVIRLVASAWASIRALWSGTKIVRPRRLTLRQYEAVQDASYWALPLAPGLEAWGVDRQLGRLDYRQRLFFGERRRDAPRSRVLFVAPEPAIAFGEKHEPGARMLAGCRLSLERDRVFYLTGDLHHYERRSPGQASVHVIAGGGGAFLHGTRISPAPSGEPCCTWPTPQTSRRLLAQVPLKLTVGTAGFMLHIVFGVIAALELAASSRGAIALAGVACLAAAALSAALFTNVGRNRARPGLAAAIALPFGVSLGLVPLALRLAAARIMPALEGNLGALLLSAFAGPLGIGVFFATCAVLGLEHQQAFCVISHPGYKHFVRLCVHPDGRVEAWVIGKDDPLGPGDPTLVDRFDWPA